MAIANYKIQRMAESLISDAEAEFLAAQSEGKFTVEQVKEQTNNAFLIGNYPLLSGYIQFLEEQAAALPAFKKEGAQKCIKIIRSKIKTKESGTCSMDLGKGIKLHIAINRCLANTVPCVQLPEPRNKTIPEYMNNLDHMLRYCMQYWVVFKRDNVKLLENIEKIFGPGTTELHWEPKVEKTSLFWSVKSEIRIGACCFYTIGGDASRKQCGVLKTAELPDVEKIHAELLAREEAEKAQAAAKIAAEKPAEAPEPVEAPSAPSQTYVDETIGVVQTEAFEPSLSPISERSSEGPSSPQIYGTGENGGADSDQK